MTIAIDVRLLARGGFSGIEEYTRELIANLIKIGAAHRFLLFYNGMRRAPLPAAWRAAPNVAIVERRIPNRLLDASGRFLRWPCAETFFNADVLWSPHFNLLRTAKMPHVITFHDLSFLHHPHFFSRKQRLWHWLQDFRRQTREARRLIAVSNFTRSDLIRLCGVAEEKISVISSGVSSRFRQLPPDEIQRFRAASHVPFPFILFLGTLEPRKNVIAAIRAFSLLKQDVAFSDLRLVIAGKQGYRAAEILREARNSPARGAIIFWGPAKDEERPLLYNAASAFVYPSFFEGFGFPPLEAQACGTPTVIGDRTALAEVTGGSALCSNPWSVAELATALRIALTDAAQREKLIRRGLENSRRFTWQRAAAQTLAALQSVYE